MITPTRFNTKALAFVHPSIAPINKIPQFKQKSEEWLNQRKGFLTSSDSGAAIGCNPYCSTDELLFKKCGIAKPFTGNIATRHGERYEDEAIDRYCSVVGAVNYEFGLIPYKDVPRENHRPELDFLAGSPDGIALPLNATEETDAVLIEVKCPFRRKPKQGYCPEYYLPQVQLNMLICNLKVADFIEYIPRGQELFITRIYRDDVWLEEKLPTLINFWDQVKQCRENGLEDHPKYAKIRAQVDKALAKEQEALQHKAVEMTYMMTDSDSD